MFHSSTSLGVNVNSELKIYKTLSLNNDFREHTKDKEFYEYLLKTGEETKNKLLALQVKKAEAKLAAQVVLS